MHLTYIRTAGVGCAIFLNALVILSTNGAQFYNDWAATNFPTFPLLKGMNDDPDGDGESNIVEFAFGTNPEAAGGITGALNPIYGQPEGTNGWFTVEVLERQGHKSGVQIDLHLSADLTNWFRPWWLRTNAASAPSDPTGSIRERFNTVLPGTNAWFVRSSVKLIEAGPETANYYVATNGNDSNSGASNAPYATLAKAVSVANPGNLIYIRDGTYNWNAQVSLSRSGSPTQPIRVRAFPGEQPVLDFSNEPSGSQGIQINGHWWHLYGLEIANAGHNGIKINGGGSNTVERCVVHDSGDTGIHVTVGRYNLILNCDSYRNYDPLVGGNADGFSAKFVLGPGNEFRGCRGWENSDDGWDLWQATNKVIIANCWTWSNGINFFDPNPATNTSFNGNGNGFKLGGDYRPGPHRISGSISFGNKSHGYDQNNNTAGQTVDQNTGWANGGRNFNLSHNSTNAPMQSVHVLRNNLSIAGASSDAALLGSLLTNNSWQIISGPAASVNDVLSILTSYAKSPRRDDGELPDTPFLRPVPNGRLVDKGANIGDPFAGLLPDLGAFESPVW